MKIHLVGCKAGAEDGRLRVSILHGQSGDRGWAVLDALIGHSVLGRPPDGAHGRLALFLADPADPPLVKEHEDCPRGTTDAATRRPLPPPSIVDREVDGSTLFREALTAD